MINPRQTMSLLQETKDSFTPFYREEMQKAIKQTGAPDDWYALMMALSVDPMPFSIDLLHSILPYGAIEQRVSSLKKLAELDMLELVGPDVYRITDVGKETIDYIFDTTQEKIGQIMGLPRKEMDELDNLLRKLVKAVLDAPEPEEKWTFASSRITCPAKETLSAIQIDQNLTDLIGFRDDAHMAAWKKFGISGPEWEILTIVWKSDIKTAAGLYEKLAYRGLTQIQYQQALDELAERGWVIVSMDSYHLTDEGITIRDKAERETNRIFFAPWDCLNSNEVMRLMDLLEELRDRLRKIAKELNKAG